MYPVYSLPVDLLREQNGGRWTSIAIVPTAKGKKIVGGGVEEYRLGGFHPLQDLTFRLSDKSTILNYCVV